MKITIAAIVTYLAVTAFAEVPKEVETILRSEEPSTGFLNVTNQPVLQALASLAVAQNLSPEDFTAFRTQGGFAIFSGGTFSRLIKSEDSTHILVVQTVEAMSIPGTSAVQLVLLSSRGKILDRLQCHMNSRYGKIMPLILDKPTPDRASIVLKFKGHTWPSGTNWCHNWHTIAHQGTGETYRDREAEGKNEWDEKGLARIGIALDRFDILFPEKTIKDQPTR